MYPRPHQLQYDPQRPPLHRRPIVRWAAVVLVLMLAAPLMWRWGRVGLERWHVQRLYQRCATYSPPATAKVWEEDPAERAEMLKLPDVQTVGSHLGPAAFVVPPVWPQFAAASANLALRSSGTLFLHELRTPSGKRRLVAVDLSGWSRGGIPVLLFTTARTFERPGSLRAPQPPVEGSRTLRLSQREGILRIFAGQADSNDPSHFTIDFVIDDRPGVIDGWLKDEGTVLLETREPIPPPK